MPLFASLLIGATGCRIGYILQAAKGQFKVITGSAPISEALENSALTSEEKARLELVPAIKSFGEKELGLSPTDNYTTVYLKSPELSIYTVSASPKTKLASVEWCFPFVGCVPYLGFFNLEGAKEEAKKKVQEDLDVYLGGAEAYSTLGWFKDPVPLSLLQGSTLTLVETLLHEMTHTTLYLENQAEFNEGLAMLVGMCGSAQFFQGAYGPEHPLTLKAIELLEDERVFSAFMGSVFADLRALYDSNLSRSQKIAQREKVFSEAKESFKGVQKGLHTNSYDFFEKMPLNNASFMALWVYHGHFILFEDILEAKGGSIKETLALFKHLTGEGKDGLKEGLAWLEAHNGQAPDSTPIASDP